MVNILQGLNLLFEKKKPAGNSTVTLEWNYEQEDWLFSTSQKLKEYNTLDLVEKLVFFCFFQNFQK